MKPPFEPGDYPLTVRDHAIMVCAIVAIVGLLGYICWSLA